MTILTYNPHRNYGFESILAFVHIQMESVPPFDYNNQGAFDLKANINPSYRVKVYYGQFSNYWMCSAHF